MVINPIHTVTRVILVSGPGLGQGCNRNRGQNNGFEAQLRPSWAWTLKFCKITAIHTLDLDLDDILNTHGTSNFSGIACVKNNKTINRLPGSRKARENLRWAQLVNTYKMSLNERIPND